MDATDTYPESHRVTAQIAREIRTARGARARNIPAAVATPLPPRNRTYGENMWPSTAASPSATVNHAGPLDQGPRIATGTAPLTDRKSTRLNSSHVRISYAVFCLRKKRLAPVHRQLQQSQQTDAAVEALEDRVHVWQHDTHVAMVMTVINKD